MVDTIQSKVNAFEIKLIPFQSEMIMFHTEPDPIEKVGTFVSGRGHIFLLGKPIYVQLGASKWHDKTNVEQQGHISFLKSQVNYKSFVL